MCYSKDVNHNISGIFRYTYCNIKHINNFRKKETAFPLSDKNLLPYYNESQPTTSE